MKRLTAIVLLVILSLSLFSACGKDDRSKNVVTCHKCGLELKQDDSYVRRGRYFCMDCYYGEVK